MTKIILFCVKFVALIFSATAIMFLWGTVADRFFPGTPELSLEVAVIFILVFYYLCIADRFLRKNKKK